MEAVEFKETQGFKTWWAWAGVLALCIFFGYAVVQQVFLHKPFGTKPVSNGLLMAISLVPVLVLLLLFSIKLKTRITAKGIYYRFYPFQFSETVIEWHELRDAYIRQYHSFYEYGGWGIRTGTAKTGRAVNTSASGNRGLQLQFTDGRLLLIGTRRPDEIQEIIDEVIKSGKINRGV